VALHSLPSLIEKEEYGHILDVIEAINRPILAAQKQRQELVKNKEEIAAKIEHDKWLTAQRKALGRG